MKKMNYTLKSVLLISIAAMTLCACSTNEVFETAQQQALSQKVPVSMKLYTPSITRAVTELTSADITEDGLEIHVYQGGEDLNAQFSYTKDGLTFTISDENGDQVPLFWPTDGSSLTFSVVFGANPDFFQSDNNGNMVDADMRLTPFSNDGNIDVVAGITTQSLSDATNGSVTLNLKHIYALTSLTLKAPDDGNNYSISEVYITPNVHPGCYYDIQTGTWNTEATSQDSFPSHLYYTSRTGLIISTDGVALEEETDGENFFIIPTNSASAVINYNILDETGQAIATNRTAEVDLSLTAGLKQRYTITLPSAGTRVSAILEIEDYGQESNTNM